MREITKYLQSFIQKEFLKSSSSFWNTPTFLQQQISSPTEYSSSTTSSFSTIDFLFREIEKMDTQWKIDTQQNTNDILLSEQEIDFTSSDMVSHFASNPCDYVSDTINLSVKESHKIGYQYEWKIKNKTIRAYLIYPFAKRDSLKHLSVEKIKAYFRDCVRKIYLWLHIAYTHSDSVCAKELNIYIYMSEYFKLLPEKNIGVLDRENANTAYTTSCSEKVSIHVCRQEEWFKVFIHETFHCLGLDFSHRNNLSEHARKRVLEWFSVSSEVNLYEAYCETFANILNSVFFVYDETATGSVAVSKTERIQRFLDCRKIELIFSILQTVKILNFYGMSYRTLIDESGECDLEKNFFRESNTNILSYYIIKMIFLFFMEEYILLCRQMNGSHFFHFNESTENIDLYVNFIGKKRKNVNLLECIDRMQQWFIHKNKCKIEHITMRLSVYE